jgi:hypothetical protein
MAGFFQQIAQNENPKGFFEQIAKKEGVSNPKQSLAQKVAGSPSGQFALGLAKRLTFPADIAKLLAQGASQGTLQEAEEFEREQGLPYNPEIAQQAQQEASQYFPTQEAGERGIEALTGIKLKPEGIPQELARSAGELFTGKIQGTILEKGKQLAKSALGAFSGAGTEKTLQAVGVPEPIANIAGAATSAALSKGKKAPKELKGEAKELKEIAEKQDLKKFKGLEKEKEIKSILGKPTISERKAEKIKKELESTSKKAIDQIVQEQIPVKRLRDEGYDIAKAYKESYSRARNLAKNHPTPIDTTQLSDHISKKMREIRQSAASLSKPDQIILKLLRKEQKAFEKKPFSTNEQLFNQYQKYNENIAGLYRKPEFAGAEKRVADTYKELKGILSETIEKKGNKEAAQYFKFANKLYHENEKLSLVENLISPSFENGYDPVKLDELLASKKGKFIERDLGKQATQDIKDIAKYGKKAQEKVLDKIKVSPSFLEDLGKHHNLIAGALLFAKKSLLLPHAVLNRIRGNMLVSNESRKAYKDYLVAASTGNDIMMRRAGDKLNKFIENQYGSQDKFIKEMSKPVHESVDNNNKNTVKK